MESTGEPLRIHISAQCKEALDKIGGYKIEERGFVKLKGKGTVKTYWLTGKEDMPRRKDMDDKKDAEEDTFSKNDIEEDALRDVSITVGENLSNAYTKLYYIIRNVK
jgi:hypothetical protein